MTVARFQLLCVVLILAGGAVMGWARLHRYGSTLPGYNTAGVIMTSTGSGLLFGLGLGVLLAGWVK